MCECPADLAKLWNERTVTDGPATDILGNLDPKIDPTGFKGRKIIGRLQTAWDYAKADHAGAAEALAQPEMKEESHEDSPWPEDRKASCAKSVRDAYGGLTFELDQIPNDVIMNRLDRMWRDRKTTLLQLDKMKHQADHELIITSLPKEQELLSTGAASLFMRTGPRDLPEVALGTIEQTLQAIQVMSNGWVLLGTSMRDSKIKKKENGAAEQVREWSITEGISWPAFCRRMAQSARKRGDTEVQVVRYLRVRERQTRQQAVKLWVEEEWPWAEAMQRVWTNELAVLWTVTMQSNAYGLQVSIPGLTDQPDDLPGNSRKRARGDQFDSRARSSRDHYDFPPPPQHQGQGNKPKPTCHPLSSNAGCSAPRIIRRGAPTSRRSAPTRSSTVAAL